MASDSLVMLSVFPGTRERAHRLKGPGKSYDKLINEALDALEEKNAKPRSQPGSNETGESLAKETV
jgi:hypothetical protein